MTHTEIPIKKAFLLGATTTTDYQGKHTMVLPGAPLLLQPVLERKVHLGSQCRTPIFGHTSCSSRNSESHYFHYSFSQSPSFLHQICVWFVWWCIKDQPQEQYSSKGSRDEDLVHFLKGTAADKDLERKQTPYSTQSVSPTPSQLCQIQYFTLLCCYMWH